MAQGAGFGVQPPLRVMDRGKKFGEGLKCRVIRVCGLMTV